MNQAEADQFNTRWESDIYAQGRQINRYPYPAYIGPFLVLFGRAPDRTKIDVLEVGCGAGNNIWSLPARVSQHMASRVRPRRLPTLAIV